MEVLDQVDREIVAALLRNGRASWRLISRATGIQERTVSRRGTRLLDQGHVRVRSLSQPLLVGRGTSFLFRVECAPHDLAATARWLAHRPETLWVATLASESAVVAEGYLRHAERASFIEGALAGQPIRDYSIVFLGRYHRTVRGWNPNILSTEQLDLIGESEAGALLSGDRVSAPEGDNAPDGIDLDVVRLLNVDGRMSIDAIAAELGVAKPTVRRRIAQLQKSDYLSIRAVVDPALMGFPIEAYLVAKGPRAQLSEVAALLASDWRSRWVAEAPIDGHVHALLTLTGHADLVQTLTGLENRLVGLGVTISVAPLLTHYKRSDVLLPPAEESAALSHATVSHAEGSQTH